MEKALDHAVPRVNPHRHPIASERATLDWRKRMSDHVAWSLLVYTTIQIVANAILLKGGASASLLPYFALVLLVLAVIPAWRLLESRWTDLSDAAAADPALAPAFARDRAVIWLAALGLPVVMTGFFMLVAKLLG
jgi:hypothetical protein